MKNIKPASLYVIVFLSFVLSSCGNNPSISSETISSTSVDPNTTYSVIFDLNYEGAQGAPAMQTIAYQGLVIEPTAPVRIGYDFECWSLDSDVSSAWNFASDTVTSDLTLYAFWKVAEVQDKIFYVDIPPFWKNDSATVALYAWEGDDKNAEWPGIKMNNVAGDVYAYTLSARFTNFVFARVSPNEPIVYWNSQTADLSVLQAGNNNLYIISEEIVWYDNNPANVCGGTWSIYSV